MASRSRPRQGGALVALQHILLGAALIGCIASGFSLYGAKVAHNKLWERLKEQEAETHRLEQEVAALRVEGVSQQAKADELASVKKILERNLQESQDYAKDSNRQAEERIREAEKENFNLSEQLSEALASLSNAGQAKHDAERLQASAEAKLRSFTLKYKQLQANFLAQANQLHAKDAEEFDTRMQVDDKEFEAEKEERAFEVVYRRKEAEREAQLAAQQRESQRRQRGEGDFDESDDQLFEDRGSDDVDDVDEMY